MSASASYAKTIIVGLNYNPSCGLFALTSAQLPGLLLAGKDPQTLWDDVPAVVKAMYRVAYNMKVEVTMDAAASDVSEHVFSPLQPSTLLKVEPLSA